jgi:hypothetical protein
LFPIRGHWCRIGSPLADRATAILAGTSSTLQFSEDCLAQSRVVFLGHAGSLAQILDHSLNGSRREQWQCALIKRWPTVARLSTATTNLRRNQVFPVAFPPSDTSAAPLSAPCTIRRALRSNAFRTASVCVTKSPLPPRLSLVSRNPRLCHRVPLTSDPRRST